MVSFEHTDLKSEIYVKEVNILRLNHTEQGIFFSSNKHCTFPQVVSTQTILEDRNLIYDGAVK